MLKLKTKEGTIVGEIKDNGDYRLEETLIQKEKDKRLEKQKEEEKDHRPKD